MGMTRKKQSFKFAIIGAGMVGTAIGFLLKKAGHKITAMADLSAAHLKRAQSYTGAVGFRYPSQAADLADCLLITTPDDRIGSVCEEIVGGSSVKGKKVFHMSGAGGLDLLESAAQAGASVASIHPLQSFSSIDSAIANIPGSYFGVTAAAGSKKLSADIVRDLQGNPHLYNTCTKASLSCGGLHCIELSGFINERRRIDLFIHRFFRKRCPQGLSAAGLRQSEKY